jgi:hypothetical protein
LGGRDSVQQQRGHAGRLGPQDLNDAAAGQATDADNPIEFGQPERDDLDA